MMKYFILKNDKIQQSIAIHHNYDFKLKTMDDVPKIRKLSKQYKEYLFDYIKNKDKWWYRFFHKKRPEEIYIKQSKKYDSTKKFVKDICESVKIYDKKIPYLNLMATQFCNLSCKGCGALMPLYNRDREKKEWAIEDLERVLSRWSEIFSEKDEYLDRIDIVGGEPLLHSNISEFCRICRKYNPKTTITIITNGLLIDKMDDDFFKTLIETNVVLSLSIYGEGIYFERINLDVDNNNQVRCDGCSGHLPIINTENNSVSFGGVQLMEDGTLYYCAFAGVKKFNDFFGTKLTVQQGSDYINIFNNSKEDILSMFRQPYCQFSKYCHKRDVFEWDISKCKIEEWWRT